MENNVNKPLPNSDKTVKNGKKIPENEQKNSPKKGEKREKKVDKVLVISIILCVAVALFVIGILTIPEPITAAVQLDKTEKFIKSSDEFTVVINAPMESVGILNDKEAVLRDKEADAFVENLETVLKNVKYSDTENVSTGVWKTKIVLYNATDESRIYVDADNVYIENNGKLISYKVTDEAKTAYSELYSNIEKLLNE